MVSLCEVVAVGCTARTALGGLFLLGISSGIIATTAVAVRWSIAAALHLRWAMRREVEFPSPKRRHRIII